MLWTPAVHATDGRGRMILTYPAGDVGYPLPDASRGSQALTTSAHLLRHYHDATTDLAQHLGSDWQFDALVPVEVICHGDFVPYLPRRHPRKGRRTHRLRRRPPRPPRLGPRLRPLPLRPRSPTPPTTTAGARPSNRLTVPETSTTSVTEPRSGHGLSSDGTGPDPQRVPPAGPRCRTGPSGGARGPRACVPGRPRSVSRPSSAAWPGRRCAGTVRPGSRPAAGRRC